ncbi:hypothetical protein LR021_04280, partial [Candidatus Bipolaricaulota bacterium]|nr:hypothetical protein [Candidatus Bipolaricaulota bacterium]
MCRFVVATLVAGYAAVTTEVVTTTPIMRIAASPLQTGRAVLPHPVLQSVVHLKEGRPAAS